MYVKVHIYKQATIVAICDEDLIGKTIEDKDKRIEVSERFYKGKKRSPKQVLEIMKHSENLNLIGKKTVDLALKNHIIEKEGIIKIKNVPHAQMYEIKL